MLFLLIKGENFQFQNCYKEDFSMYIVLGSTIKFIQSGVLIGFQYVTVQNVSLQEILN